MKQYSSTECPKEWCAQKLRIARILKKSFQNEFDLKRIELEGCLSEVKELTIFNEGMLNSSFAIRLERVQREMTRLTKKLLIQSRKVDSLEIEFKGFEWYDKINLTD
jgi:hypothetical protein